MIEQKKGGSAMRGTKRKWIPIAVILAAAVIVYLVVNFINRSSPVSVSSIDRIDTVVIDAGHGGLTNTID